MPSTHTVEQGDTMISIALANGFSDWKKVWEDEANAELRGKREDPQVLQPGDEVAIPEPEVKTVELETGVIHYFVRKAPTAPFSLTLLDEFGDPRAGCRYIFDVEDLEFEQTVPEDGVITHALPASAQIGMLSIFLPDEDGKENDDLVLEYTIQLGHLDPIEELSGVQARLVLLGYTIGKVDGKPSTETTLAIQDFQLQHMELEEPSGELDDETREAIDSASF